MLNVYTAEMLLKRREILEQARLKELNSIKSSKLHYDHIMFNGLGKNRCILTESQELQQKSDLISA